MCVIKSWGCCAQGRLNSTPQNNIDGRTKKVAKELKTDVLSSFSPLAEMVSDGVCLCDSTTLLDINRAGLELLGFTGKDTPIGKPFTNLIASGGRKTLSEGVSSLAQSAAAKRLDIAGADGRIWAADVQATTLEKLTDEDRVLVIFRPINPVSGQMRQILEAANEGIIGVDLDGHISIANPTAAEILDRDLSALRGMSIDGALIVGTGSDQAGQPLPVLADMQRGKYYVVQEARLARGDGMSFEAEYAIAPMRENKETTGYVLTLRDVTERKQAESELRLAATVFDHTSEGLLVADSGERVTKVNRAFTAITGLSEKEVVGQPIRSILFFDDKVYRDTMTDLQKNGQVEWEQWCKNKAGDRYAARQALSLVRGADGEVQQFAAILNDITERKLDEEQIRYQANYDQLTGIPNRALFMDRLARLVIESRRTKTNIGLMFIDLDGFKAVNDSLGHDAGDLLLKQTADRLNFCVRESDTVARLGGDEFTVIMPLIDSIESTVVVAERILQSLTDPFDLDGQEGRISASIGISIYPEQADDDKQLLHKADVAMFHAKSQGKANYQFYRDGLEIEGVPEREA
jgi:diguanylate cyclase (GGDEF)-like protein/PAS domain S-box-containing protein